MTIAVFLPSLQTGGAERAMMTLAGGLAARGRKVDLVLASAEGPLLGRVPAGVRVVDLKGGRVFRSRRFLAGYLRRERPAALLSSMDHANVVAIWSRKTAGVPTRVVVNVQTTFSRNWKDAPEGSGRFVPMLARWLYPKAGAVVAVSRGVAEDLARSLRLKPEGIRVIQNPLPLGEIAARAEEEVHDSWFAGDGPPVVLAVGRLHPAKDYPTLLRAFALLRQGRAARLLILGEGAERPRLEAIVDELGLSDHVRLAGNEENPYRYMARASVLALSSRWEGLGMVLAEALACGTTVVASDCESGPSEVLERGKYGRLVPAGDAGALARAIAESLDHPFPAGALRERARFFSVETVAERYLEVLDG